VGLQTLLIAGIAGSNLVECMEYSSLVLVVGCVGKGLCDGLITRSGVYRVCVGVCVCVCVRGCVGVGVCVCVCVCVCVSCVM
jgi:hypothetical protein